MEKTENENNEDIYKILHNIQTKLKSPKDKQNHFGKYKYRNVEGILEAAKPYLPDGVVILLSDEIVEKGSRIYVRAVASLVRNSDSFIQTVAYARECENKKGMDEAQVTGACSSYARKYALCGLLAVDGTDDIDELDNRGKEHYKPSNKYTYKFHSSHERIDEILAFCVNNEFEIDDSTEDLFVTTKGRISKWDKYRHRE